jgi:hypothetical protein
MRGPSTMYIMYIAPVIDCLMHGLLALALVNGVKKVRCKAANRTLKQPGVGLELRRATIANDDHDRCLEHSLYRSF